MLASIDVSTYGDAARLLVAGNQDAGQIATTLFSALAAGSLSTGTTPGAAAWAEGYTSVAQTVTDGISALVSALGNAALLVDASGDNHARAEAAAAPYGLPSYALPQRAICTASMTGLPPVFGGNADEPGGWHLIASHLSGYLWPGADLPRLAALADAWLEAASGLQALAALPDRAGQTLGMMRSPELPAAVSACTRLASLSGSLADDCTAISYAVRRFAQEVQRQRDPIVAALKDLVMTVVWCELGSGAVGLLTAGGGEVAGKLADAAIIARCAGFVVGCLRTLDEALPALRPAVAGTTAADRAWLAMVADARPVVADVRTSSQVLQSELDAATAAAGAKGGAALTDEQAISSGWADRKSLADHLERHGADVGASTETEYVQAAQDLLSRARSADLPMKVAKAGRSASLTRRQDCSGRTRAKDSHELSSNRIRQQPPIGQSNQECSSDNRQHLPRLRL